jgi:hypothetical protein
VKLTSGTITDEQIRQLRRTSRSTNTLWLREYAVALGEITTTNDPAGDRIRARARCAEILNARANQKVP